MKKLLLFLALFMATPMFVGCSDEEEVEGGLRKSDLYGTWKQGSQTMTINKNGTYSDVGPYVSSSGTWSFDGYSRIWVQHRNDGNSYTNIIHLLNKTTFSYTDQYGNHDVWSRVSNVQNSGSDSKDEPDDKPEPEPEPEPEPTTGTHRGHEWVDLGLSVKWATCNVGASIPSDYGDYFAWGETSPKNEYYWENYKHWVDHNNDGWCDEGEPTINSDISGTRYDAARANWGGSWRMPTKAELDELLNNCEWWYAGEEKKAVGPNGNSIILPLAGYYDERWRYQNGDEGHYWSSTPDDPMGANALILYGSSRLGSKDRAYGLTIRPVLD